MNEQAPLPLPKKRMYTYDFPKAILSPAFLQTIVQQSDTHEQYLFDEQDIGLFLKVVSSSQQNTLFENCSIEHLDGTVILTPVSKAVFPIPKDNLLVYDSNCSLELCQKWSPAVPAKWDAIAILTTTKEDGSGRLSMFLQRLLDSLGRDKIQKHLYVIVNNQRRTFTEETRHLLDRCRERFQSTHIVNLNISEHEDIYNRNYTIGVLPPLGTVSGPNTLFFRAMDALKHHDTVLCFETDCFLKKEWISTCETYICSAGKFLIAGALYDGSLMSSEYPFFNHLNGIAFYRPGSSLFQLLMKNVELYIRRQVLNGNISPAYDSSITECIDSYIFYYMKNDLNYHKHTLYCNVFCFWRYIYRLLIHTTHIVNVSVNQDRILPVKLLDDLYDGVIIHKKDAHCKFPANSLYNLVPSNTTAVPAILFSFSLYGTGRKYTEGMIRNCEIITYRFPTARVNIYATDDVPATVIERLSTFKNTTLIHVVKQKGILNMFDRFLGMDNKDADYVFIRDADSRVHERDATCIEDFIASGKSLHIIRDHFDHLERIMGGMVGIQRLALKTSIREQIGEWKTRNECKAHYGVDQHFLAEYLYPTYKESVFVQDRFHIFPEEVVAPFRVSITNGLFVGQVHEYNGDEEYAYY